MMSESLLERLKKTVAIEDRVKMIDTFHKLFQELADDASPHRSLESEVEEFEAVILSRLRGPVDISYSYLLAIYIEAGLGKTGYMADSPLLENENFGERGDLLLSTHLYFLSKGGVLLQGETPLYADLVKFFIFDGDSRRSGFLYLTNKRMLVNGFYNPLELSTVKNKALYYENAEEMPYLGQVELLEYDKILSCESHWGWRKKHIELVYDSDYIESKSRTIYGPLFFRMELARKQNLKKGPAKLEVHIDPLAPPKGVKDYEKKRQEELYRRIMEHLPEITNTE